MNAWSLLQQQLWPVAVAGEPAASGASTGLLLPPVCTGSAVPQPCFSEPSPNSTRPECLGYQLLISSQGQRHQLAAHTAPGQVLIRPRSLCLFCTFLFYSKTPTCKLISSHWFQFLTGSSMWFEIFKSLRSVPGHGQVCGLGPLEGPWS